MTYDGYVVACRVEPQDVIVGADLSAAEEVRLPAKLAAWASC